VHFNVSALQAKTTAQLLLRWPRNAAQVELLSRGGGTFYNFYAFFLRNLWEYHHKSYIAEK